MYNSFCSLIKVPDFSSVSLITLPLHCWKLLFF
jgi:hypothetical protein